MDGNASRVDGAVAPGKPIYTRTGRLLGHISSITEDGFTVETDIPDGVGKGERSSQVSGERYLMWKCRECGEMGELKQSIPANCPNCDASREAISEVLED